ncbi:HlyD family secretion protein [Paludibaculum fermentans]|uniref:HlyD family efflux transporter periplasmic adaptor subunit n=1 Tax=Paludibaculum fermentans TaxID=1473598 RepID=A0A7S7NS38_PALFE|nr:hypothetical protein [Paludibaculum fermentans]QOY88803.1 hypothetical protein IRI77_02245 [Paludibaculum fermentans]
MKPQTTSAVVLLTTACLVGAVWTHANLTSTGHWRPSDAGESPQDPAPFRLTGELVSVSTVPVEGSVLELEVPLNAQVRKGQVIGETQLDAMPAPAAELDARRNLAAAAAAVEAARTQLQDAEARVSAARARAEDTRNHLVGAEVAAGEVQAAVQRDEMLYREGMESQLKHDEALSLQQSASRQIDTQSQLAGNSLNTMEQLESQQAAAQAALQQAEDDRRAAESAVASPQAAAVRSPVLAPADGYLVLRDEFSRDLEIVSDLNRQVETRIPQSSLFAVHIGQLATVTLDSQPKVVFHAVVRNIGDAQASAAGAFCPVTLSLTDASGLGNDTARATITLQ